jgi:hypothetical protein
LLGPTRTISTVTATAEDAAVLGAPITLGIVNITKRCSRTLWAFALAFRSAGLGSSDEVDDENYQQDDHQNPDESVAGPGHGKHESLLSN